MKKVSTNFENEYVRIYTATADAERGSEASDGGFTYTENMYANRYSDDGALESIPGCRKIFSFGERINAIYKWQIGKKDEHIFVHAGSSLYRFKKEEYESLDSPTPIATLKNAKSSGTAYEGSFYIFDGERITRIRANGNVAQIDENAMLGGLNIYTPTTYVNALANEQRNLLSDKFIEQYTVSSSGEISFGSPELIYTVTDEENMCCTVIGVSSDFEGDLYIPSNAIIGERIYKVSSIASDAFMYNSRITSVTIGDGVPEIQSFAFWGAYRLKRVTLGTNLHTIGAFAFYNCPSLEYFYMGAGVKEIGVSLFKDCNSLLEINYALDADNFALISNSMAIGNRTVNYEVKNKAVTVKIPVMSNAEEINLVLINGEECAFEFNESLRGVIISFEDKAEIEGKTVEIYGTFKSRANNFYSPNGTSRIPAPQAILGCTVCCVFDGRLFISGNPQIPGIVFYSSIKSDGEPLPLYFGASSYFIDGTGDYRISSLVSSGSNLISFKDGDDGSGSIFYHRAERANGKPYYPLSYVHGRVCAEGEAYPFLNSVLFVSTLGLTKLKSSSGDYKSAACESESINHLLLKEDLSGLIFSDWLGYLVLTSEGHMYLGDSPKNAGSSTDKSYKWYYISGVGSYKNDTRVYRYSDESRTGYAMARYPGEIVEKEIFSTQSADGELIYYVNENRKRVIVYPTDEYIGGEFSPATTLLSIDELLFFGTDIGDLCVFNNDKMGKAPDDVSESGASWREDRLHKSYYSFCNHAVRYAVSTSPDDCGVSYLEKSTVYGSLMLKLKTLDGCTAKCEIITDTGGIGSYGRLECKGMDFYGTDFSKFTTGTADKQTVSVNDRSRDYFEKQIIIYSDDFASPFGIYSMSYRYKLKSKAKKNTM